MLICRQTPNRSDAVPYAPSISVSGAQRSSSCWRSEHTIIGLPARDGMLNLQAAACSGRWHWPTTGCMPFASGIHRAGDRALRGKARRM